jgi:HD-GYP domain-containing protein (c-di-GMP phosphodiesterase class II)
MHPETGYEILKSLDLPWPIAEIIRQHHERIDGSGYPRGLSGEDILLEARILSVADVVEAMSSHRPHRPSLGLNHALHEILKNKGRLYDADVVDACLKVFREMGFEFTYRNGEPSSAQTLTAASVHK